MWISDDNGNKASVEYFGSEEAAREALGTLTNCQSCVNCVDCKSCVKCENCTDCVDCRDCRSCSGCRLCNDCGACEACADCSTCSSCKDCDSCRNCKLCTMCYECSYVDSAINCQQCVYCSLLQDSVRVAHVHDTMAHIGVKVRDLGFQVPAIEDIHKKIYAAASKPKALNMSQWHDICGTAHCRAGWVTTLAGEDGLKLDKLIGTPAAAKAIYGKSDYNISVGEFFKCRAEALQDMKELATQ